MTSTSIRQPLTVDGTGFHAECMLSRRNKHDIHDYEDDELGGKPGDTGNVPSHRNSRRIDARTEYAGD